MIGPRMATMLAFLLTDAPVWRQRPPGDPLRRRREQLQLRLGRGAHQHQRHRPAPVEHGGDRAVLQGDDLTAFAGMVRSACESTGPDDPRRRRGGHAPHHDRRRRLRDRDEARAIARAVADSPLVKTAIHGADPNWGRIVSAAGYAGVPFEEERTLALAQRRRRLPRRASRPLLRRAPSSRRRSAPIATSTSAWCLTRGEANDPLLDLRPDRRVRPTERRLHDLERFSDARRTPSHTPDPPFGGSRLDLDGRSQGLQVLDEIGDFLRRKPQSEEAVVVVDDGLEVREPAVVVVAPLGMGPEPSQRRRAIAERGRPIGLEVVDADLGGQVQVRIRVR